MKKIIVAICFFLFSAKLVVGQNIADLFGKGNLFKLNGGINSSMIYNFSSDPSNQREPFTAVIGGNINLYVAGINIPASFSYSNAKISVAPPMYFNQLSLHPNYKWATAHIGTSTLSFSPYSLNGHQFDGFGLELNPGNLKLKLMEGRLLRGTGDYLAHPEVQPFYKRKGQGADVQYKFSKNLSIGASLFHAKDDPSSAINIPYEMGIFAKENIAATINTSITIVKDLKISAELAGSYLTGDINSTLSPVSNKGLLGGMISHNGTSQHHAAQNIKLAYTFKSIDLGLEYEKVDYNYQTLGTYANLNGFENTLMRFGVPLFNGKINVNGTFGIQNDLTDSVASQNAARFISSLNLNYNPTDKLSLSGNFSNNRSITNFRNLDNIATSNNLIPYYLDSLRLVQIDMNAGVNMSYQLASGKDKRQSLNASYTLQNGTKKAGEFFVDEEGNRFHNANINLSTSYPKATVQWSFGFNYNLSTLGLDSKTSGWGPAVTFGRKVFNKKVPITFSSSYNTTYNNLSAKRTNTMNLRYGMGYNYKQRHDFKLAFVLQFKNMEDKLLLTSKATSTGLISVNYNYIF